MPFEEGWLSVGRPPKGFIIKAISIEVLIKAFMLFKASHASDL
jgi:hypothetical protein